MEKYKLIVIEIFIIGSIALIIFYLLALNGRYLTIEEGMIMDKWKKEVIIFPSDELPLKYSDTKK